MRGEGEGLTMISLLVLGVYFPSLSAPSNIIFLFVFSVGSIGSECKAGFLVSC